MEIEPANIDIVGLDEAALMRGFLHLVEPGPDAIADVGSDEDPWPVGIDADECPPCSGDFLTPYLGGYLLISEHADPGAITALDGWSVSPYSPGDDWELERAELFLRVLKKRKDGQVLLVVSGR